MTKEEFYKEQLEELRQEKREREEAIETLKNNVIATQGALQQIDFLIEKIQRRMEKNDESPLNEEAEELPLNLPEVDLNIEDELPVYEGDVDEL